MATEFEKKYAQKFERLYEKMLVDGKQKIGEDLGDEIFWEPTHKGHAFAYRVQQLEKELRQNVSKIEKAEWKTYEQRLAEGRKKISKEIVDQTFFTPGTSRQAFAYRVQQLEKELRKDLLLM